MTIPRDKLQHLVMGAGAVGATLIALWIAPWSVGAACAFMSTLFAVFYEAQQWYRREGQPDIIDALATAAPGLVPWAVIELI